MPNPLTRIVLCSDAEGIPSLLAHMPRDCIAAIIGATIRPHSHAALQAKALEYGVPFFVQPRPQDTAAYTAFMDKLHACAPDSLLCSSYAMRVQPQMLALVKGQAFNIHAALLPKNRGPNPLQWALIHGDDVTGITLHMMDEGFDTGSIIAQESIHIAPNDTWVTLAQRVSDHMGPFIGRHLPALLTGHWNAIMQDIRNARINPRISKESFAIDFSSMSDKQVYDLIRAQITPLAGAYINTLQGRIHIREFVPLSEIAVLRARYV